MFKFTTKYSSTEQKLTGGGTIPAGVYSSKIVEVTEKESKAGNPMLVLTLEVDPVKGRTVDVAEYLLLNERSAWKIERWLAACGHTFGAGQEVTLSKDMLLGKKPMVATYYEPSSKNPSQLYLRILTPLTLNEVTKKGPMDAEMLESFGLRADGTKANVSIVSEAPAPASAAGQSTMLKQVRGLMPHEEEDDIPF